MPTTTLVSPNFSVDLIKIFQWAQTNLLPAFAEVEAQVTTTTTAAQFTADLEAVAKAAILREPFGGFIYALAPVQNLVNGVISAVAMNLFPIIENPFVKDAVEFVAEHPVN